MNLFWWAWTCNCWESLFKHDVSAVSFLPYSRNLRWKKRRVDADRSLQIPTSAGSLKKSKLSLVFEWKSCDQPGSQVLFLPAEWVLRFSFTFCKMMHVLSLCICDRKKKKPIADRNESLNYFGSSEKQVCLPVSANRNTNESANVYEVTEAEPTHSGGNLVASWFSDTLKWTHKHKHLAHDALLFSVFLSGFLSASLLLQYTHSWVHFTGKTWI